MYPKHFFERFWEGSQENQLFVGIAFDDSVNQKFRVINNAAKKIGFKKAFRVGLDTEANSINDVIFDGIAHSKMLLFDLSDDERYNGINPNVIYELGIANVIRESFDIVLIRKISKGKLKLPFDIQGLNINFFNGNLTEKFIKKKVSDALKNQEWHKSKRVKAVSESIDDLGLGLMIEIGRRPKGWNHFNTLSFDSLKKLSVHRLMDLGILWFATGKKKNPQEYAYHWTPFGYEVMKYLSIPQMTFKEFKKRSEFEDALKNLEGYFKNKGWSNKKIKKEIDKARRQK
ncbi:MAG: hypothetical protein V1663_02455 [archaeon]